jgi:hypothetical protein
MTALLMHKKEHSMTGPEHYKEAESLLRRATGTRPHGAGPMSDAQRRAQELHRAADERRLRGSLTPEQLIATAQVHAMLALAAATALSSSGQERAEDPNGMASRIRQTWESAAGESQSAA